MKIVVIGGTGLIGSQVVKLLQETGNEVIAASPKSGVDTLTGEGLAEVLAQTQVVIDVSNSPSFEEKAVMDLFTTSNENLLAAEKIAGVQHHIALSVVGTQELQSSGYFRAKQVQEEMIQTSGIAYTIVHATQFFEFAGSIVLMSQIDAKTVLPDANIQPIASKDVASFMAKIALSQPSNNIVAIGGPEKFAMTDWIGQYAKATNKTLDIIADKDALYSGSTLEADTLVPNDTVYLGETRYDNWIAVVDNQR